MYNELILLGGAYPYIKNLYLYFFKIEAFVCNN